MGTNQRNQGYGNRNDRNNDRRDESGAGSPPWGNAYYVVDNGEGKKATWIELGAVWRINGGFNVVLRTLPVGLFTGGGTELRLVVQQRKERE